MEKTIEFYNRNAAGFFEDTVGVSKAMVSQKQWCQACKMVS